MLSVAPHSSRYDVAITGGGLVGLTFALALARLGLSVALVEREALAAQALPAFDGRVCAIARGSKHVLAHLGAWQGMRAQAEPIYDIRVSDGDAPFFLDYHHQEIGEEPFGWIVENRFIRAGLMAALEKRDNVTMVESASVRGLRQETGYAELELSDGRVIRAALVVAADGKHSRLRALAEIGAVEAQYGQTALVATIGHTLPHEGLAQERFLPGGPFAVLPMTRDAQSELYRSSLVWTEATGHATHFLRLPEAEFVQEIRERVGDYLGEIRVLGARFSYPLTLMHAKSYIAPRLALIGDAAHAIHPIAGQGVNLGWRDVAVLAELIEERQRLGMDIGSADCLERYQRWRRFDNVAMLAVTDGLNRLFTYAPAPLRLARGLGLWGVAHMPPAKRFFMRHAMGLVGDLPRMIREAA